jgi:hypothetical protein
VVEHAEEEHDVEGLVQPGQVVDVHLPQLDLLGDAQLLGGPAAWVRKCGSWSMPSTSAPRWASWKV